MSLDFVSLGCGVSCRHCMGKTVKLRIKTGKYRFTHRVYSFSCFTRTHTHCSSPEPALPPTDLWPLACYDKAESGGDVSAFTFLCLNGRSPSGASADTAHDPPHPHTHTHTHTSYQSLMKWKAENCVLFKLWVKDKLRAPETETTHKNSINWLFFSLQEEAETWQLSKYTRLNYWSVTTGVLAVVDPINPAKKSTVTCSRSKTNMDTDQQLLHCLCAVTFVLKRSKKKKDK